MRTVLACRRPRWVFVIAAMLVGTLAPRMASAESLLDVFFGGLQKKQQRNATSHANSFTDPFGVDQRPRRRSEGQALAPLFACAVVMVDIFR